MQIYLMSIETGNGDWINLPADDKEVIDTFIKEIGNSTSIDEEFIIAEIDCDDELDLKIGEFDDVYHINELLIHYESLEEYDKHRVLALIEENGNFVSDFENALSSYEDYILLESIQNQYTLGEFIVGDTLYDLRDKIPSNLFYYIDFEAIGRDAIYNGEVTLTSYGALY